MDYKSRTKELIATYKGLVAKKQWLCRSVNPLLTKIDEIPDDSIDLRVEAMSIQKDVMEKMNGDELTIANPYESIKSLTEIKDVVSFYRKEAMDMMSNTTMICLELYIISRKEGISEDTLKTINNLIAHVVDFTVSEKDMEKCIELYDAGVTDEAIKFLNDIAQRDLEEKEKKEECKVEIDEEVKKTKKKSKKKAKKKAKKERKRFDDFKEKASEDNYKKVKVVAAVAGVTALGFGLFKVAQAYLNKDDVVVIDNDLV